MFSADEEGQKKGIVSEIHIVCHNKKNVSEDDTHFVSKWWKISKKHVRPGVRFALHEHRNEKSYLQGEIVGIAGEHLKGSLSIRVRKLNTGMDWCGTGAGEKGYRYKEEE